MKPSYDYLALGDSLTAGVGAPPNHNFIQYYHDLSEQALSRKIILMKRGYSGFTTGDILMLMQDDLDLHHQIAAAHIITITAGGNDLIQAAKKFYFDRNPDYLKNALQQSHINYKKIIDMIKLNKKMVSEHYMIRIPELFNPYPLVTEATFWITEFNKQLRTLQTDHLAVANVYDTFKGRERGLLSQDGIHPNEKGYNVMAQAVHKLGYAPLGS